MNKLLSRIAIAIASFAMVIGGAYIASNSNKQQAEPAYAEDGDVVATFESELVVNYKYQEWVKAGWKVSWGGDYECGFENGGWKTFEEQGYTKYLGSTIDSGTYGIVITKIDPMSYVGSADFNAIDYAASRSHLYLMYSLDDVTYTPITLLSGEQGCSISRNTTYTFDFTSMRSAYYAFVITSEVTEPASNVYYQFDNVVCHFYEKIDPAAERIAVTGPNTVYTERDIELAINSYNFNPTEFTVTSSDTSIATVSHDGNTITVHGVDRGTVGITVSAMGTDGLVYIDPFTVTVKKFEINLIDSSSITIGINELKIIRFNFQDYEGNIVAEAVSANTNAVTIDTVQRSYIYIKSNSIEGITTTVTITGMDNDGAEGCHITSAIITVTIGIKGNVGERVVTLPDMDTGSVQVYLGTIDGSRFVKRENSTSNKLLVTTNIKEALVLSLRTTGILSCRNYNDTNTNVGINSIGYIDLGSTTMFQISTDYENLPGALYYGQNFISYNGDNDRICAALWNQNDPNPSTIFCAYLVTPGNPYITPDESSLTIDAAERTESTGLTVAGIDSLTYEILSGDSILQSVSVSEIDDSNTAHLTVRAKDSTHGTAVIRVKSATDDSVYHDITVTVKADTTAVESLSTHAKLSYSYSKSEENITLSDVAIRFGGQIDKTVWNALNNGENGTNILGYGVMLAKSNEVNAASIENAYASISATYGEFDNCFEVENGTKYLRTTAIKNFYNDVSTSPAEQGNYYYWNLYKSINVSAIGLARSYTAVAYVRTASNGVVFLGEVSASAAKLASEAIATIDNINETTEGSMEYLAGFYSQN